MKQRILCVLVMVVWLSGLPLTGESDTLSLIHRVENGLNPGVIIGDAGQWTLKERMAYYGVPGLSLAVIQDYKIHWARGYGVADTDSGRPVTDSTLFQAASISKPVTAAVALRLVQDGILRLDQDVNQVLTSWKIPQNQYTKDEKVTLRRLLSHSAGLTVHGFRGYGRGETVPDILDVLDGRPPANTKAIRVDQVPGSTYRYSGGGYTVLQLLIEDVTGRSLACLARELILDPLGMRHSSFQKPLPDSLNRLVSAPHSREGKVLPAHWFLKDGSACCGLWTTSSDLARFAVGIQRIVRGDRDGILAPETGREMLTPANSENMGLGFALSRIGEAEYFQHSGGNPPGFSCLLFASRNKGYGIAAMTNSYGGSALIRELLRSVADAYGWDGLKTRRYDSIAQLVESYRLIRKQDSRDNRIAENTLNTLGYLFLQSGQTALGLKILQLNSEFYPQSANGYDSLGDAYRLLRDERQALASYRKALDVLERFPEQNKIHQRLRRVTKDKIEALLKARK